MNPGSAEIGATRVVLRPHLWRRPEVLALGLSVPVSISTWWRQPDPGPLWASLLVVAFIAAMQWPGRLSLLITGQEVSCSPRLVRRAGARRAPRDEILAVEVWRSRVVLSGENGDAVLSLRPCWTLAQCGDMAAHLGVPLVRHQGRKDS